jgi:hypothetical protein
MKAIWFKDCKTKEEKEKLKQSILSQKEVLDRLKGILEPMLKGVQPANDYDKPSWAFKQADRNGFNRALTDVLDLIKLDKE